jgi:hypothetical protein
LRASPGAIVCNRRGIEAAANTGGRPHFETIIELKD